MTAPLTRAELDALGLRLRETLYTAARTKGQPIPPLVRVLADAVEQELGRLWTFLDAR